MRTVEELKGMTQEDLVRLVQKLECDLKNQTYEALRYEKLYQDESEKVKNLTSAIRNIVNLI